MRQLDFRLKEDRNLLMFAHVEEVILQSDGSALIRLANGFDEFELLTEKVEFGVSR